MSNRTLNTARIIKNDEFYTRISDIDAELKNYKDELKGKKIFLNCDGPHSAFLKYFRERYDEFGLADLKAIGRDTENGEWVLSGLTSSETIPDGDFRNMDSIHFLLDCDVVITNPPFSLFRSWFDTVMSAQKNFIVLSNQNAVTYKNVFPYIKENKVGIGCGGMNMSMDFDTPDHDVKSIGALTWMTSFHKPGKKLTLTESYYADTSKYPKYDNYDAINVNKIKDIPYDYAGIMGVPITFIQYMHGDFNIIAQASGNTRSSTEEKILNEIGYIPGSIDHRGVPMVNGKLKYARALIKNNNPGKFFEIVSFGRGDDGKDLVFTRERERELNPSLEF